MAHHSGLIMLELFDSSDEDENIRPPLNAPILIDDSNGKKCCIQT